MKRILLLPLLLLSGSAAAHESVFLKCSYQYLDLDGRKTTGIHEFSINPVTEKMTWIDISNPDSFTERGNVVIRPESYKGGFTGEWPNTTGVEISRVNGRFTMKKKLSASGYSSPQKIVETKGQCSKTAEQKAMF